MATVTLRSVKKIYPHQEGDHKRKKAKKSLSADEGERVNLQITDEGIVAVQGKMWGLVLGVFTLAIIQNGMQLAGWNQYVQYIIQGAILILAIGFDRYQRNRTTRRT